jgi:uncharacterized protein (UPF0335 family)
MGAGWFVCILLGIALAFEMSRVQRLEQENRNLRNQIDDLRKAAVSS